jgi:hypothetical protein
VRSSFANESGVCTVNEWTGEERKPEIDWQKGRPVEVKGGIGQDKKSKRETGTTWEREMCPDEGQEGHIEGDAGPQAGGALVLRITVYRLA